MGTEEWTQRSCHKRLRNTNRGNAQKNKHAQKERGREKESEQVKHN